MAVCASKSVWNYTYYLVLPSISDLFDYLIGDNATLLPFHGACCAAVASVAAALASAPFDTLKVRLICDQPSLKTVFPWASDLFSNRGSTLFYSALPLIPRAIFGTFFHTAAYNYMLKRNWEILRYNAVLPFFIHLYVRRAVYLCYPIEVIFLCITAPIHLSYNFWHFFEYKEWNPE